MLGFGPVETAGHLRWMTHDTEAFVRDQLSHLLHDLVVLPALPQN